MKAKKIFLFTLLFIFLIIAGWLINLIWFKPFSINHFYTKAFVQFALYDPELITTIGLPVHFWDDELTDISLAQNNKRNELTRKIQNTLRSYDYNSQSKEQKLSTDIMDWFIDIQVEGIAYQFHNYPVNQLNGIQNELPSFMVSFHNINSTKDARNYITRLNQFELKFNQLLEGLEKREEIGIIPPKFVIERVLIEMEEFIGKKPEENILFTSFNDKIAAVDLDVLKKENLKYEVLKSISEKVYPAYKNLINYFLLLKSKSTTDDGVWKLPDGNNLYKFLLRAHTTTSYNAEEVHQMGLSEVNRITSEMRAIFNKLGYSDTIRVGELMVKLSRDENFLYPNNDNGRSQLLADYQKIIDHINLNLDSMFSVKPTAKLEVARVPEFKEKTSPAAYYERPAQDGSRPGTFFINLRNLEEQPKYGMATLAYHEAVPGHHFQIAIQLEQEELPFFRTIIPFTSYIEGWALYAEQLAWEYGFFQNDFDNLGRLQSELFRAVRLVVDSGIHYKRWTREKAIDYMLNITGMPEGEVVTEIERYIVDPGQACSYKLGMMKILDLREKAKLELGNAFDIKKFHNVILRNGAMPLNILEKEVEKFIQDEKLISL